MTIPVTFVALITYILYIHIVFLKVMLIFSLDVCLGVCLGLGFNLDASNHTQTKIKKEN